MNSAYWTSNKFSSYQHSHSLKIYTHVEEFSKNIRYDIKLQEEIIRTNEKASEQSYVAIKYQVLVYSEEIEELRMAKWSYCLEK